MDWQALNILAALASIISLIFAITSLIAARAQTKKLSTIADSLSTQYIGALPAYYPMVVALIRSAKHSITIMCDYPAYGCVTNSKQWFDYYQALLKKSSASDLEMTLVCPDRSTREATDTKKYFPAANKNWEEWLDQTDEREYIKIPNRELVRSFARQAEKIINGGIDIKAFINNPQKEIFFNMLQEADATTIKKCFNKENCVYPIENPIPIDFWIVDGVSAIFAFSNYGVGMSRYGFRTNDQTLIQAFEQIIDNYR